MAANTNSESPTRATMAPAISFAPELTGLAALPASLREKYGKGTEYLQARRLVEAGVPFITVYDGGWDHHTVLFKSLKDKMPQFDQGFAGLVSDLHARGLLESPARSARMRSASDLWSAFATSSIAASAAVRRSVYSATRTPAGRIST